jgi:hypothetical protein
MSIQAIRLLFQNFEVDANVSDLRGITVEVACFVEFIPFLDNLS